VAFDPLRANPAGYVGKTVLLGGYIVSVQNLPDRTSLTVLQTPLGSGDRPESPIMSEGRFVVVADGFLDPAVYHEGIGITVAGTVTGPETVQIDQISYPTVGIKPVEMHLWPKETGYYRGPYYYDRYDPFYYNPYFYNPYFYDPWYPWPRWPAPYYPYRAPGHHHRR
jgi:outer membrane lipoprotein